ncbi:MAG: hypothetical protein IJZ82_05705 [Lachnospiraceae bacterium]|nr:hypothetical protein [Lachnospiraceae bacterium]
MTNKEKYQQAFSALKASRKIEVEDIIMNKSIGFTRGIAVAAAIALCFVGSNSICYAATGNTWVEKMVVFFSGQATETDVTVRDLGNGDYSYTVEVPEDEASVSMGFVTEEDGTETIITDPDLMAEGMNGAMTQSGNVELHVEVVEENGLLWLVLEGQRLDITEDFTDGEVEGTFSANGKEYKYLVTGTKEEYGVSVELCE